MTNVTRGMVSDLVGRRLESELIEYSVVMKFDEGWSLLITSPFTLNTPTESHLHPDEDPPSAFEPVRQLIGRTVTRAHATEHGALEVVFTNDHTGPRCTGSRLRVLNGQRSAGASTSRTLLSDETSSAEPDNSSLAATTRMPSSRPESGWQHIASFRSYGRSRDL